MRFRVLTAALLLGCSTPALADPLWDRFATPPADARPMVRWWWFGPAVTDAEIDREIAAMKAGGFGGFEVQPSYPLVPDSATSTNLIYLSRPFLARLAHAGETARAEGMRIDVTIGTGWPFGGPSVPIEEAASEIRRVSLPVAPGVDGVTLPLAAPGEAALAAFADGHRLAIADGRVALGGAAARSVDLYVAGRTGQQVKRAAVGGEGYVLDHMDGAGVAHYLHAVGDALLTAFPKAQPPYAMFSDSLEAYGSSWTGDFAAEFRKRRGYDIADHLPALFDGTAAGAPVRYDWGRTLTELVGDHYLGPAQAWAAAHGTRFRAQVYGIPPVVLSSNARVALPEGEGADWRHFSTARLAASAAHLYGRPVVSAETWTWLHSPTFAATPLDMKIEADRHFLQGINQLIGHGWPYSPPGLPEPGQAFYAAAALNDHNPWYPVMSDLTRYLARASAMLRVGTPANRVAIYLPSEDAFAGMDPKTPTVNGAMGRLVPGDLIAGVLDAGFGFDFIDAQAITAGKLTARILVLPPTTRIDAAAFAAIAKWTEGGGEVVAIDHLPDTGGGLLDGAKDTAAVRATGRTLAAGGRARIISGGALRATLAGLAPPDMQVREPAPTLGFVRRRIDGGDLYFVANTGNAPVHTAARFQDGGKPGQWWDPRSLARTAAGTGAIAIDLAPYESRFLIFADHLPAADAPAAAPERALADLSRDWTLAVPGKPVRPLARIAPWSDAPDLAAFSGTATYRHRVTLPAAPAGPVAIDFGPTPPRAEPADQPARPRSAIVAPVREAALVTVNGKPAGALWAPPYRVDVSGLLKAGDNEIAVTVMNTALNAEAEHGRPDLRLLTMRYGERFENQDQDKIRALPSGLTGPVTLVGEGRP